MPGWSRRRPSVLRRRHRVASPVGARLGRRPALSSACRRRGLRGVDRRLEAAIGELLASRARRATICPSEAARHVDPDGWRELMEPSPDGSAAPGRRGVGADPAGRQSGGPVHHEGSDPDPSDALKIAGSREVRHAGTALRPSDSRRPMSIPTDENRELLSVVATMRAKPGKSRAPTALEGLIDPTFREDGSAATPTRCTRARTYRAVFNVERELGQPGRARRAPRHPARTGPAAADPRRSPRRRAGDHPAHRIA